MSVCGLRIIGEGETLVGVELFNEEDEAGVLSIEEREESLVVGVDGEGDSISREGRRGEASGDWL